MNAPSGLGIWLWDLGQLGTKDWSLIATRCAKMGLDWVCIKAALFIPSSTVLLNAFNVYGITVYTWHYSLPNRVVSDLNTVLQCKAMGSQGHVIDAEVEYVHPGSQGEAKRVVEALRGAVGDWFLAYAPFCDPAVFPQYPYQAFHELTAMPQVYWTPMHRTASSLIDWIAPQWAKLGLTYDMPILSVWGSNNVRGLYRKDGAFLLEDFKAALEAYKDKPAVSLWALESIHPDCEHWLQSQVTSLRCFRRAMRLSI